MEIMGATERFQLIRKASIGDIIVLDGKNIMVNPELKAAGDDWWNDHRKEAQIREQEANEIAGEAETAAAMATVPDNEVAHEERTTDCVTLLGMLADLFPGQNNEYVRSGLLKAICKESLFSLNGQQTFYDRAADRLKAIRNRGGYEVYTDTESGQEVRRYTAGARRENDIDDERLTTANDWFDKAEFQLESWQDLHDAAKRAYKAETGKDWMKSAPKIKDDTGKTTTLAQQQSDERLERIAARRSA